MFQELLIPLRRAVQWSEGPPDLVSRFVVFFFLSDNQNVKVYKHRPRTINESKTPKYQEITAITSNMVHRMKRNFTNRLQMCIAIEGHHQDIIFKISDK